jgi:hypothetical protein
MREEYRQAYSRLIEERFADERRLHTRRFRTRDAERYLTKVRDRVQRGIGKANLEFELRPDTEYALIVCFEDLIALPVFLGEQDPGVRRDEDNSVEDQLLQFVEDDTALILRHAGEMKSRNIAEFEDEKLTAGDVMRTISEVYDDLSSIEVDVWG